MREILFRGKFGDKWKYGYLTIAPQSLAIKEPYACNTTTIWCVALGVGKELIGVINNGLRKSRH